MFIFFPKKRLEWIFAIEIFFSSSRRWRNPFFFEFQLKWNKPNSLRLKWKCWKFEVKLKKKKKKKTFGGGTVVRSQWNYYIIIVICFSIRFFSRWLALLILFATLFFLFPACLWQWNLAGLYLYWMASNNNKSRATTTKQRLIFHRHQKP